MGLLPVIPNSLAVYATGQGEPSLLLPYPHGFPAASSPLGAILQEFHYRVGTFDPQGKLQSTRLAQVTMQEMQACAVAAHPSGGDYLQ